MKSSTAKRPEMQAARETLTRGHWFGRLPCALQDALLDSARIRDYLAGEIVSCEDQPISALRAVLEGQIAVTRQIGDETYLFHIGGPGFWFGELAALSEIPTTVTFTARAKLKVLAVPKSDLEQLLSRHPAWYQPFIQLLVQRESVIMRAMAQAMTLSPKDRLRTRLADIADLWRTDGSEGKFVELAISKGELAAMVGVTRQYVGRFLRSLEEDGLIELSFRSIRIIDVRGLRGDTRATGFRPESA